MPQPTTTRRHLMIVMETRMTWETRQDLNSLQNILALRTSLKLHRFTWYQIWYVQPPHHRRHEQETTATHNLLLHHWDLHHPHCRLLQHSFSNITVKEFLTHSVWLLLHRLRAQQVDISWSIRMSSSSPSTTHIANFYLICVVLRP